MFDLDPGDCVDWGPPRIVMCKFRIFLAAWFDYDVKRLAEHLRAGEKAASAEVMDIRDRRQARVASGA